MEQSVIQINGGITINVKCKKHVCGKDYVCNPSACVCENGKYLLSIMNDSVIMCDEIIDVGETNFNEKNVTCKTQNFYILLAFLLITITLVAISICCYLIKYWAKQKHYHFMAQN